MTLSVEADGNLSLPNQQKLSFEIAGTIAEINVKKGDRVLHGQVLARLDDASLKDSVTQAELAVLQREQALNSARYDLERVDQQIEEAKPKTNDIFTYYTDMPKVQSNIGTARDSIEAARKASREGRTADVSAALADALKFLDIAYQASGATQFLDVSRLRPVADTISSMRQLAYSQDKAQAAVTAAQLALDSARVTLAMAKKELAKAAIAAPFTGLVADVPAKVGDRLSIATATSTTIVQLIDPDTVEMEARVDEVDIPRVKLGQDTVVRLDALPQLEQPGKVNFISSLPTVKAGVVTYKAVIGLRSGSTELKDGMSGTARITYDRVSDVLLVPDAAVRDKYTRPWVEVVSGDKVEKRNITLGRSGGREREVVNGLKAGDLVVLPQA